MSRCAQDGETAHEHVEACSSREKALVEAITDDRLRCGHAEHWGMVGIQFFRPTFRNQQ
jgi:hypothetical protein